MDEQRAPSAQLVTSKKSLLRVLAGSVVLSFFALFSIAYFYGSVQTAGDVLITQRNYWRVNYSDIDPQTGKKTTYYVGDIQLIDHQSPEGQRTIDIRESAYSKIFETLQNDHLAVLKRHPAEGKPLMTLVLHLKPLRDSEDAPYQPLILQQVDFYGDDQPYRISGRRDKKTSGESWFFAHKDVCKQLNFLLQLVE